jgi:hypothetical protein
MSTDLNKKTLRHFYCRDALWQCFEKMSEDFDRGVDDMVNEAMRVFAREKGYLSGAQDSRPTPVDSRPAAGQHPTLRPPPLPPPSRASMSVPPALAMPAAAPAKRTTTTAASAPGTAGALCLVFQNQRYPIDKDQFIIGRGVKTSDLPIRDGNISRKHAAVIRRNGSYYIKDLGSTNGIDFNGVRVDNRKIEEGDVYYICEYQLKFTYR